MSHGFNEKLSCEGIIGDGCGGGRIFFIKDETLFAHDPQTKQNIKLLEDIHMPRSVSKKGCVVSIECEKELIKFDLSSMSKTLKEV
ncbi:MAG: thiamine biosynthesis protein ThiF [Helicobacteraceae bacterium CG2_30_36_10]|nr:MAG: thiamine biosynthesis protein ThiF [Helicobacteraceae bacterium CG2_30_36_10]